MGTLSILEAMLAEGINNIVVSGTCAVYGEPASLPISENLPANPVNPYGRTKLVMEQMLKDFQIAHGLNWISLRYFNAAGSSPDGEIGELHNPETHLIPCVINAALGRLPEIKLFGTDYPTPDGTCIRDYIHVDDLASAHILAAEHLLNNGQSAPINLGTGTGSSVREIIEGVRRISGKDFPIKEMNRRAGDPAQLVADFAKAREVLGWRPQKSLDEILYSAWNFLSKH